MSLSRSDGSSDGSIWRFWSGWSQKRKVMAVVVWCVLGICVGLVAYACAPDSVNHSETIGRAIENGSASSLGSALCPAVSEREADALLKAAPRENGIVELDEVSRTRGGYQARALDRFGIRRTVYLEVPLVDGLYCPQDRTAYSVR